MMQNLFLSLLEVSLGTALLIALVLAVMPLLGKIYKQKWRYWAWLLLAVRLLIPFSVTLPEPAVSLPIPQGMVQERPLRVERPSRPQNTVTPPVETPAPVEPVTPTESIPPSEETIPPISSVTPSAPVVNTPSVNTPVANSPVVDTSAPPRTVTLLEVVAAVWATVAVGLAVFHGFGYLRFVRRAKRFNRAIDDPALLQAFDEVAFEMGLQTSIGFYRNATVTAPLMVGFFKPAVLLPQTPLASDDCRMVLRHELLHYKRRDLWYKLLLLVARCVHWFNPLVWVMAKRADNDLEIACDEDVVREHTADFRQQYCETILRVVRSGRSKQPLLTTAFCVKKSVMKRRFTCVLDQKPKRIGAFALAVCLLATTVCGALIGCEIAVTASSEGDTSSDGLIFDDRDFSFNTDAEIAPYMETVSGLKYLHDNYPHINDWTVIRQEERVEVDWNYKPSVGKSSERWMLCRYALLETKQSEKFEVLAVAYVANIDRLPSGNASLAEETFARSQATFAQIGCTAQQLQEAEYYFADGLFDRYSVYLPSLKRLLITEEQLIPVNNIEPEYRFVTYRQNWNTDYEPMSLIYTTYKAYNASYDEDPLLLLYNPATWEMQTVGRFSQGKSGYPIKGALDTASTVYATPEGLKIFRLDNRENWHTEPYAVIPTGDILPEGRLRFWNTGAFITDRNNPNRHAALYYDESLQDPTFHLLTFTNEGEILSNYDLKFRVFPTYSHEDSNTNPSTYGAVAYASGVYYFNYLNRRGARDRFATDTRPGQDHTVQQVLSGPAYADSVTVPDSAITRALRMFGADYDSVDKRTLLVDTQSFFYRTEGFVAADMTGYDALSWANINAEAVAHKTDTYGNWSFSAQELDALIQERFYGADIANLHQADCYDAVRDAYVSDGIGGTRPMNQPVVDYMSREQTALDDGWLRVDLQLDAIYDHYMTLTVDFKQQSDGSWSFRYVSYLPSDT